MKIPELIVEFSARAFMAIIMAMFVLGGYEEVMAGFNREQRLLLRFLYENDYYYTLALTFSFLLELVFYHLYHNRQT